MAESISHVSDKFQFPTNDERKFYDEIEKDGRIDWVNRRSSLVDPYHCALSQQVQFMA